MIFIYRAIDSGMVSYLDVKHGAVSLADIIGIVHYLNMKSDVEYANMHHDMEKGGRGK